MSLQKPKKAYQFALITTIFSVLGGIVGYFLGDFLLDILLNYHIIKEETVSDIATWFKDYGIYVVAIAAFSPLPFKLACISAGLLNMSFLPFVLFSFVS
ncbi:MAG: VTT domain-containing protein, partial [Gammaproteobacteria bacterium]